MHKSNSKFEGKVKVKDHNDLQRSFIFEKSRKVQEKTGSERIVILKRNKEWCGINMFEDTVPIFIVIPRLFGFLFMQ